MRLFHFMLLVTPIVLSSFYCLSCSALSIQNAITKNSEANTLSRSATIPNPLGPPEAIHSLKIHHNRDKHTDDTVSRKIQRPHFDPSFDDLSKPQQHTYEVTRVARNSDVFLLKGFLTSFECEAIIHEAKYNYNTQDDNDYADKKNDNTHGEENKGNAIGMTDALSIDEENTQQTRTNCKVAWMGDSRIGGICGMIGKATTDAFVTKEAKSSLHSKRSDMQVLHYEQGGRFVLHHDGIDRILTVICYLNGVGETWLPLVDVHERHDKERNQQQQQQHPNNECNLNSLDQAVHKVNGCGMTPGNNGILISGSATITNDKNYINVENKEQKGTNPHIISVDPGDAVAFYSYQQTEMGDKTITAKATKTTTTSETIPKNGKKDFRSIHAGLPVEHVGGEGKWLATCWFHAPSLIK